MCINVEQLYTEIWKYIFGISEIVRVRDVLSHARPDYAASSTNHIIYLTKITCSWLNGLANGDDKCIYKHKLK